MGWLSHPIAGLGMLAYYNPILLLGFRMLMLSVVGGEIELRERRVGDMDLEVGRVEVVQDDEATMSEENEEDFLNGTHGDVVAGFASPWD
jgi:hypothetical protein